MITLVCECGMEWQITNIYYGMEYNCSCGKCLIKNGYIEPKDVSSKNY